MFFEILLLSVLVTTAYLAPALFRRLPPGQRTYVWMLSADALLAAVAFAAHRSEASDRVAELLGVIAIGASVCLVMVPPMLRDGARRALLADRLRLALLLCDLRELLAPGMGARQERELIEAIARVRAGRVEEAVAVLEATRNGLEEPLAQRQVDERIVLTYLSAQRWQQAADAFDRTIESRPGPVSPQLLVEMVRALCELGDLAGAARLMARIEESPMADEPMLTVPVNRARLMFLAFVGRTSAVENINATGPLAMMPAASRRFWSGVARLHAGDASGARVALTEAARLSRGDLRAREIAQEMLERLEREPPQTARAVPPHVAELADRVAAAAANAKAPAHASTPQLAGVTWRRVPVTVALIAVNVAVAGALYLLYGTTGDMGGLVRAGASVKSAVMVGQWWRLPSSTFLHVGALHLLLNMFTLWVLGKLVEQMLGHVRFFALYMVAGLGGALASLLVGGPVMSIGASGAVLGVMGAAVTELGVYRKAYPARWRSSLFGTLVFIAVAQIGIGFVYPAIDQAAHIGGFVAGAAAALVLSRKRPGAQRRLGQVLAGALALLGAGAIGYAAWGVASTDYADTVAQYPRAQRALGGLSVEVPVHWQRAPGRLADPSPVIELWLGRERAGGDLGDALAALVQEHERGLEPAELAAPRESSHPLAVPSPWQSRELVVRLNSEQGPQSLRVVVFGRYAEQELWLGALRLPEALAGDLEPLVEEMLRSVMAEP